MKKKQQYLSPATTVVRVMPSQPLATLSFDTGEASTEQQEDVEFESTHTQSIWQDYEDEEEEE